MKVYELSLLLAPSLSEEEARSFVSTLTQQLGDETTTERTEVKGLQYLSYPIRHQTQGHRIFIELKSENGESLVEKVQKALAREEKVLRHFIVIKPKAAPPRPKKTSVLSELRREKHVGARSTPHRTPAAAGVQSPVAPQEKPDIEEIDKKIEELLQ